MGQRLVRSRALESWSVPGAEHQVRPVIDIYEHLKLLSSKLIEESMEFITSENKTDRLRELGDIYDVLEAFEQLYLLNKDELTLVRQLKVTRSGTFNPGMVWDTER